MSDDLRQRYAEAIWSALPRCKAYVGPVANAVLAVRDDELERLRGVATCHAVDHELAQESKARAGAAERKLAELTVECSCATTYATYEGPEADCPVHGAVRAFHDAQRTLAAVWDLVSAESDRYESAYDLMGQILAALDGDS